MGFESFRSMDRSNQIKVLAIGFLDMGHPLFSLTLFLFLSFGVYLFILFLGAWVVTENEEEEEDRDN